MKKLINICIKRTDGTEQEIVLYPGDTFEVELSHEQKPVAVPKFKIGDNVRLVRHGKLNDESSEWTIKDGLELRHIYTVKRIENTCIRVNEDGCWCESAHFEFIARLPMPPTPAFREGDIVRLVQHGTFGQEYKEWTVDAGLKIGQLYKVSEVESDGIYLFGSVSNSTPNYVYHPNHFELVATQEVPVPPRALKKGDIVKFVRAGAMGWEGTDWAKEDGLEVGHLYTIARVNPQKNVQVEESKFSLIVSPLHFEYVATLVDKDC